MRGIRAVLRTPADCDTVAGFGLTPGLASFGLAWGIRLIGLDLGRTTGRGRADVFEA